MVTNQLSAKSGLNPEVSCLQEKAALILIADNDEAIGTVLSQALENEDYQLIKASNGRHYLEAYTLFYPEIVLLDALMPVINGCNCGCQRNDSYSQMRSRRLSDTLQDNLRSQKYSANASRTPVIMMTALSANSANLAERTSALGTTDYIAQPIHITLLRQQVRYLLQRSQTSSELQRRIDTEQMTDANQVHDRQSLNFQEILSIVVSEVRQFVNPNRVQIYRINPDWDETVVVEAVASDWLPLLSL